MSLLDKSKNFIAKKVVAPAMIIGAGIFGYQGQAQEEGNYQLRNYVPLTSFTLDHDNDGFEDVYVITKNPYENEAYVQKINNYKGTISTKAKKQIQTISLGSPNN